MPSINCLPAHVADLIAAGEVVERPASVVKELVENAIDAGAAAVTVELQRGGMGLIRVTDDGCGIAPSQLPTAFLRHATSKLRRAEDLSAIATLGFRGEALAAIAAVSRLDIFSRERGAIEGASLHLEGGTAEELSPAGAPEGTTIVVRDLFFNTPARLKFMKKDSAETAAVLALMQHLSLSHPSVSFRFIKDGTEALHTPGDSKTASAVYAALGRDFARDLLEVTGQSGKLSLGGFVTKALCGRGSRGMQSFFVNGRYIKSQLLTAALEEGYRNQMLKGRFPGCVLYLDIPVTELDVNVHPAKTQVKFAREKDIFDLVYHTVLDTLDGGVQPRQAEGKAAAQTVNPRGDFFQSMDAGSYRAAQGAGTKGPSFQAAVPAREAPAAQREAASVSGFGRERAAAPVAATAPVREAPAAPATRAEKPRLWDTEVSASLPVRDCCPPPGYGLFGGEHGAEAPVPQESHPAEDAPATACLAATAAVETNTVSTQEAADSPEPVQEELALPREVSALPVAETPWRIIGEALRTYILCEAEDGSLWLIDKHAAHERVHFDRLRAEPRPLMRQQLLAPLAVELPGEDAALLLGQLPLLERFGFGCEEFGAGTILVREVPADIDADETLSTLEELAERLRLYRQPEERMNKLYHTMACKAAMKAGMQTSTQELRALVDRVQGGEVRFCPHGRPVAVRLSQYELEKMFKRA